MLRNIKRQLRACVAPAVFLAIVGYFVWNAARGDLGLRAYTRRQTDLTAAMSNLQQAQAERDGWQRKVAALQPAHLDLDALDERARILLNLAAPGEIAVPTGK